MKEPTARELMLLPGAAKEPTPQSELVRERCSCNGGIYPESGEPSAGDPASGVPSGGVPPDGCDISSGDMPGCGDSRPLPPPKDDVSGHGICAGKPRPPPARGDAIGDPRGVPAIASSVSALETPAAEPRRADADRAPLPERLRDGAGLLLPSGWLLVAAAVAAAAAAAAAI